MNFYQPRNTKVCARYSCGHRNNPWYKAAFGRQYQISIRRSIGCMLCDDCYVAKMARQF